MHTLLEAIGWIGSVLVVVSLTQSRVLRFRWMNLVGSVVATVYNAIINVHWLARLYREAKDPEVYQVVAVPPEDPFLQPLLQVHAADIATHAPDFTAVPAAGGGKRSTLLVVRGDEAVGVVAISDEGAGVGSVELDWVKRRFGTFTPGQFVYRDSGALPAAGFRTVTLRPHGATDTEYLRRAGVHVDGDQWVRDLEDAA